MNNRCLETIKKESKEIVDEISKTFRQTRMTQGIDTSPMSYSLVEEIKKLIDESAHMSYRQIFHEGRDVLQIAWVDAPNHKGDGKVVFVDFKNKRIIRRAA